MAIFGSVIKAIKKYFAPKPAPKPAPQRTVPPSKLPSKGGTAKENLGIIDKAKNQTLPKPFNPNTPFGTSLPANVQKAPSTPSTPASSGGGGGGGGGGGTPSQALPAPFDPSQSLGEGIPTMAPPPSEPMPAGYVGNVGSSADILGEAAPFTAGDILDVGSLGVTSLGTKTGAKVGEELTAKMFQNLLRDKATKQILTEAAMKAERLMAGEGIESLVEIALRDIGTEVGKKTVNTKTVKLTLSYLQKLTRAAKSPKVVLGLLIGALGTTVGAVSFARLMNPNAQGDITYNLNTLIKEAEKSKDPAMMDFAFGVINDTNKFIEEADGVLGDWSPLKYSKTELKKWDLLNENAKMSQTALNQTLKEEADNKAYWEEQRQWQTERDTLYQQNQEDQRQFELDLQAKYQQAEEEKRAATEARDQQLLDEWELKQKRLQKQWEQQQKNIRERDELLAQQREAEWTARIEEFNRQQKIYMDNWEKRQKYYQEQRGSNLGFGLIQ